MQEECLSKVILFGGRSLRRLLSELCRALPCGAESSGKGQRFAVLSGSEHPPRAACAMRWKTGRTLALLPSGGQRERGKHPQMNFDLTWIEGSPLQAVDYARHTRKERRLDPAGAHFLRTALP